MSTFTIDHWSPPKDIPTRNGPRIIRTLNLEPENPVWVAWRHDKNRVKSLRFSVGKEYQGTGWQATHWEAEDGQFQVDLDALNALIAEAKGEEVKAKEEQRIDFVAESYEPLTTGAAAKLYDWQKPSCQRIIAALKNGNALDASQTGAGKTYVALAACAELGLTPFVIAPLAVLEAWRRASTFMGVPLGGVTNYDKARAGSSGFITRNKQANRRARERSFAFSPTAPHSSLFDEAPDDFKPLLIFDEVQKTKGGAKTLQGQLVVDTTLQGAKILALSATAAKDPLEMEGIGLTLGLHEGGASYSDWAKKHGCRGGQYGLTFTDNPRVAAEIMQRIHRAIFPKKGTRIRSADVPGYPENAVTAHLVESSAIVQAYSTLRDNLNDIEEQWVSGKMDKRTASAQGLAEIMAARRSSEYGKIEFMVDETRELVADGFQVAIFLNFREHLAMMRDALKMRTQPVWGTAWLGREQRLNPLTGRLQWVDIDGPAQTPIERQALLDGFQEGRSKIILVSLMAGGAGISLHDDRGIAPRQSLVSPSYSAIDLVQAVGRIWRAGSHSKATQRIIYAAGTIEEEIAASVTAKIGNIERLNDGDMMPDCLARFTHVAAA